MTSEWNRVVHSSLTISGNNTWMSTKSSSLSPLNANMQTKRNELPIYADVRQMQFLVLSPFHKQHTVITKKDSQTEHKTEIKWALHCSVCIVNVYVSMRGMSVKLFLLHTEGILVHTLYVAKADAIECIWILLHLPFTLPSSYTCVCVYVCMFACMCESVFSYIRFEFHTNTNTWMNACVQTLTKSVCVHVYETERYKFHVHTYIYKQ